MSTETRSGIKPAYEVPTYKITTQMAHDFIQKKVNAAIKIKRQQAAKDGDDVQRIEDVEVTLVTSTPSKKFCLFLVLLPMTATQGKKDTHELSIFNPEGSSSSQKIKPELYAIFKNYMFTDKERKALTDSNYRKILGGISVNTAGSLARHMTPKIDPMGISKKIGCKKMVGFFIDPVKVFQDMLTDPKNPGKKPSISIDKTKKYTVNNFEYTVKVTNTQSAENKHFMEDMASAVNAALNTRMPRYDD